MGLGGSVFHWHPEHRISFVFLPTYLDWTVKIFRRTRYRSSEKYFQDFAMERGVKLRDIVFDCVMNMKK